jgi:hypothetical protein
VFNVFTRTNSGSYAPDLRRDPFGDPEPTSGNAYVPRSGQLGFRLEF